MTEQESLRLITEMIDTARNRIRRGEGNISMVWGYVVMTASLLHFGIDRMGYPAQAPMAWLLIFVGVAYSVIFSLIQRGKDRTVTHIDRILDHLWLGFSVCMIVVGTLGSRIGNEVFTIIELLYGLSLFVSGAAFRFQPLTWGGVWCWAAAIVSLFVPFPYHLLILAASVLGYIIPGWLLNRQAHV